MEMDLGTAVFTYTKQIRFTEGSPEAEKLLKDPSISNVEFFLVQTDTSKINASQLKDMILNHLGEFDQVDPFDGKEHNYIELGAFLGDQGLALCLMGMGETLGLWKLLTPSKLMPFLPKEVRDKLVGNGMIAIMAA